MPSTGMRLYCIVVAVAIVLQSSDAVSILSEGDTNALELVNTARFLWTYKSTSNEERGVSIPNADKLDDLLQKGISTDGVFKLLVLDKAADDILGSPQLDAWITYMKLFNGKNPSNKASLIATLTTHYDDDVLAKMIEAAKQIPTTAVFAKRVQTELVQQWLVAGKTPDEVFILLKLDKAGTELFAQPQVVTWAKYMDDFNKVNLKGGETLLSALKKHYKDEKALVQMLIAAEKVSTTKTIATRIQAEQTHLWLTEKKEPATVFKLLELDTIGLSLFSRPLFGAWVKYTDDFRKIHFGTKLTTIAALREYYRDDVLAKMLLAAGKVTSTSEIANRLHSELVREWYIKKFAPEHVFKLLRLDKTGEKLFESPLFNTWAKFMGYFRDLNPNKDVTLLTELTKVYSELELSKVLIAALNVPRTKQLATKLLSDQLDRWLVAKKDPLEVFHSLGALSSEVSMSLYKNYRSAFNNLRKSPLRNKP